MVCVYDVFRVLVGWKQFIFWSFDPNFSNESIRVGCDNEIRKVRWNFGGNSHSKATLHVLDRNSARKSELV